MDLMYVLAKAVLKWSKSKIIYIHNSIIERFKSEIPYHHTIRAINKKN